MKADCSMRGDCGVTLFEVLLVIGVVLVLAAVLLPTLTPRTHYNPTLRCMNDLKQVGLSFKVWEGDNNDKFPMQVSVTNGGTMELVGSGAAWLHFQVMSNELNTPKILFCPTDGDARRCMATIWGPNSSPGPYIAFTGDSNTSYFVGVDATDLMPNMPLAGDRNLTLKNLALNPGLHAFPTNAPVGWSDAMHKRQGNVLFADGSVQGVTSKQLPGYFHASGVATNRLAVP